MTLFCWSSFQSEQLKWSEPELTLTPPRTVSNLGRVALSKLPMNWTAPPTEERTGKPERESRLELFAIWKPPPIV